MATWRLVDGRDPADSPEAFPAISICTEAELRHELDRLREQEPAIVSLNGPNGAALQIGIGGPLIGMRWFGTPRKVREVLADHIYAPGRIDFRAEGDSTAFWPEHLMPADQAIEVIVSCFTHGGLPDWVRWREWDASRGQWHVNPAVTAKSA